jgi:hypothetical protein
VTVTERYGKFGLKRSWDTALNQELTEHLD